MNFKTKLAVLAIGAAMGSMAFNASACSTVIVGKDASATGNILVGHNEDNGCLLYTSRGVRALPRTADCPERDPQIARFVRHAHQIAECGRTLRRRLRECLERNDLRFETLERLGEAFFRKERYGSARPGGRLVGGEAGHAVV